MREGAVTGVWGESTESITRGGRVAPIHAEIGPGPTGGGTDVFVHFLVSRRRPGDGFDLVDRRDPRLGRCATAAGAPTTLAGSMGQSSVSSTSLGPRPYRARSRPAAVASVRAGPCSW